MAAETIHAAGKAVNIMATQASSTDARTLEPPSPSAVRLVPYVFARDARLLVARQDVDSLEVLSLIHI